MPEFCDSDIGAGATANPEYSLMNSRVPTSLPAAPVSDVGISICILHHSFDKSLLKPACEPMAGYELSGKAGTVVDDIFEYTIVNFGIEQARDYLHGLSDRFKALAEGPLQGRVADEFASGLSRYEYQSHVIFFREMEQYTLIVRHTQVRRRVWVVLAIRTQDYI